MQSQSNQRTWLPTSRNIVGYYLVMGLNTMLAGYILYGAWFNSYDLLAWDALHYRAIALDGYVPFRQAFFPFLPAIWKLLDYSPASISTLNGLLYLLGLVFLAGRLKPTRRALLAWLVLPSSIFFFVPYTESIFFIASVLVIAGVQKDSRALVVLGLFLCTITRPAFSTLLPSLILAVILVKQNKKEIIADIASYVGTSLIGILIVSIIQHYYTGEWMGFYKAQDVWGNHLQLPSLPLGSWGSQAVTFVDALAFLTGVIATFHLFRIIIKRVRAGSCSARPEVIISLGCISSITLLTLLFRGGELFSLNRFVFATPFVLVLMAELTRSRRTINAKEYGSMLTGLVIFFMAFGAYGHIQTFIKFLALSIFILLTVHVLYDNKTFSKVFFVIWVILAALAQLYFAQSFLAGEWVG